MTLCPLALWPLALWPFGLWPFGPFGWPFGPFGPLALWPFRPFALWPFGPLALLALGSFCPFGPLALHFAVSALCPLGHFGLHLFLGFGRFSLPLMGLSGGLGLGAWASAIGLEASTSVCLLLHDDIIGLWPLPFVFDLGLLLFASPILQPLLALKLRPRLSSSS